MRLCAVIPSYRHATALPRLTQELRAHCETVFVVDDGNDDPVRRSIAALHAPEQGIEVLRRDANGGKGAAVVTGLREALRRGFTHALQLDADGQHDTADIGKFVQAARESPEALICGKAAYDSSVPRSRKFGRTITHFWVWVETLSLDIADSMCGFRVYPLAATGAIINRVRLSKRMEFDTEIAVRLHWRGVRIVNLPTRVVYPPGNISNFQMLHDNVRISLMHTRLALQGPFRVLWRLFAPRRQI